MSSHKLVDLFILLSYSKTFTLSSKPLTFNLKHRHFVELYELASHSMEEYHELKLLMVQQDTFGH